MGLEGTILREVDAGFEEHVLDPDMEVSATAVSEIAHHTAQVRLSDATLAAVNKAQKAVDRLIADDVPIYGITSGFGPLADAGRFKAETATIQTNLIYHLASGVGPLLSWADARALMTCRLIVLSKAASGASPALLEQMARVLNAGLAPTIPSQGTVGASGDLTPSAHMALCLKGETPWITKSGEKVDAGSAQARFGLPPHSLQGRDGLALVNGTSAMTGIAALALTRLKHLVALGLRSAAAAAECMRAREEAYSDRLAAVRPHPGQAKAARSVRACVDGSRWLNPALHKREPSDHKLQDPYSLRCLPQIFGAILDLISPLENTIDREINSVTDNPVLSEDHSHMVHGGNFYGQHVAFACDQLSLAAVKLGVLLDRQLDLMCDPNRSDGLPAFLCRGTLGKDSGLMGAQVTATALATEMRAKLGHVSVLSSPTNGHNQDVNSMGTVAARQLASLLDDLGHILAIHLIAVSEAFDLRIGADLGPASQSLTDLAGAVRTVVPAILEDRALSPDIQALASLLATIKGADVSH